MNILSELLRINRIIAKRVKKNQHFYLLLIALLSIFIMVFVGVPLFSKFVEIKNEDYIILFPNIIFIVLVIDISLMLLRFQSKTLIEPSNLIIFPIKNIKITFFNILLLLFDYKIMVYVVTSVLFFVYFFHNYSFIYAFTSIMFFILFLLMTPIYFMILYKFTEKYLLRHRKNVIIIIPLAVIFLNVLIVTDNLWICAKIPIINFIGDGLYALYESNLKLAIFNGFSLFLCIFFGVSLLFILSSHKNNIL